MQLLLSLIGRCSSSVFEKFWNEACVFRGKNTSNVKVNESDFALSLCLSVALMTWFC